MSKKMLIGVIASAVLAVGAIAAVTATAIVDGGGGGGRVVQIAQIAPAPAPQPGQGLPPLRRGRGGRLFGPGFGPLRGLRNCLEQHGLGRPNRTSPPDLQTMRDALKACRGTLPRSRLRP